MNVCDTLWDGDCVIRFKTVIQFEKKKYLLSCNAHSQMVVYRFRDLKVAGSNPQ